MSNEIVFNRDIYVHQHGSDEADGFQSDPVGSLMVALDMAAAPAKVCVNDDLFPDCCERPNPRTVWALMLAWPRTKWAERIQAALSWVRFVAECESCGATWLPVESTLPGSNFIGLEGVTAKAAVCR